MMLQKGYPKSKIAKNIGVHRSTIYREINRNSWVSSRSAEKYYTPVHAQGMYIKRRKAHRSLMNDERLRKYIESKLLCGWSPKQIEGRLKQENHGNCIISHETIYRYIYSDHAIRNRIYHKLRRKHFHRAKRGSRKPRFTADLMIHSRPEHINNREDFWHWEADLMMFKRGIKGNLITLRERKSRYVIAIKNENKKASNTAINIVSVVKHLKSYINSITFDQGSEFMQYNWIKDCLVAKIYFCDPGAPHQKGAIENVNGVIRAELPRSYDIDMMKQKELTDLISEINNRPLKCLNYKTPAEVFETYKTINEN